jgi:hypothetical protein
MIINNHGGFIMAEKYVVRLDDDERQQAQKILDTLSATSEKSRRAYMLLKADISGPNWTDAKIAEAISCRTQTIENVRKRLVTEGFEATLNRKKRSKPPTEKLLSGKQEAAVIAMRLGEPPEGFSNWTLRLLTERVVALEITPSVSHETIRTTLKKTR